MTELLRSVLDKTLQGHELTDEDLACLLTCSSAGDLQKIFAAARAVRRREFGDKIFLYGFVYFSTYCRNNCRFCYFRHENRNPVRYRKSREEILATALELKKSGVNLIDLTMGEDAFFLDNQGENLIRLVREVHTACGIPVMVSPGVLPEETLERLAEAGADWYALYQETHNREMFSQLRLKQDYDLRMKSKKAAARSGLLLEEGLLSGLGESTEDLIKSFHIMKDMKISQGRSMTFVPQKGTPMEDTGTPDFSTELKIIAALRLYMPDILIPASLDVDGIHGLQDRLMAGANVVTSIIPPRKGLAGVANAVQDIDEGFRTVAGVEKVLRDCGLRCASTEEYREWIDSRKKMIKE